MDSDYLRELAHILESMQTYTDEGVSYIRIDTVTAHEIAERLRNIAFRMPNMLH